MPKWVLFVSGFLALVAGAGLAVLLEPEPDPLTARLLSVTTRSSPASLVVDAVEPRDVSVYAGLGAWVDVFDYSPAYAGDNPSVTATSVVDMAENGIGTVFLQAARLDDRSPEGIEDRWLLAEWLLRADASDIALVGWYLPKWSDGEEDLDRLLAISNLEVLGRRFGSVAVDIEWTADDLEPDDRSQRLIELSAALRLETLGDPLGAIVLPPVLIEVVNDEFWPGFPWAAIAQLYDVWLPMSYWSFRSDDSPYKNAYTYNFESTERLRINLGDPAALVHGIGGIGSLDDGQTASGGEPRATVDDLPDFAQSLVDTGSIGGSIYDWDTTGEESRRQLLELFSVGIAAQLDRQRSPE